jgi:hypothetical protein
MGRRWRRHRSRLVYVIVYRGTTRKIKGGRRGAHSYTPSLEIAAIWSARPEASSFSRRAVFLPTTTVHANDLDCRNLLDMRGNHTNLSAVLQLLQYGKPNGITDEEVLRVFNYLQNRVTGKAKGGAFAYRIYDEDGDEVEEDLFSYPIANLRDEFSWSPSLDVAEGLVADTFIFVDAPRFQLVAKRLGYDCVRYADAFAGAEWAAPELLGKPAEDVEGVTYEYDLEMSLIPTFMTYRPLSLRPIRVLWSRPTARVFGQRGSA